MNSAWRQSWRNGERELLCVDIYISLLGKIHLLELEQSSSVYFTSHGQLAV